MLLAKGTFYNVRTAAVLSAEAGLERRGYEAVHDTLVNYQRFFAMAPFAENQLIQAHNPEHPALEYMLRGDVVSLLSHEHREREALGYPPFGYRIVFRAFSGLSVSRLTEAVSGLGISTSVPSAGLRGSWEIEARILLSQSPREVARQFFSALETSERRRAGVRVDP
jgi:primosomal protein N'